MNDLIAISNGNIGSETVQTVNARDLHSFLEVGKDFSTWIKDRVEQFNFTEGQDFVIVENLSSPNSGSAKARPQIIKDYHLTLDMAKELSMVERNEKGKQARQYFIECERRAKSFQPTLPPYEREAERVMVSTSRYIELLETENKALRLIPHTELLKVENKELRVKRAEQAMHDRDIPTSKTPAPSDNVLQRRFLELYGGNMSVKRWCVINSIDCALETACRAIYRNHKVSPQVFALLAAKLNFSKQEILGMLTKRGDAKKLIGIMADPTQEGELF